MRPDKARGFVLNFDDVDVLNSSLNPQDAMAVIVALSRYAQDGTKPAAGELCPAAAMAFAMMVRSVDKGLENLKKRTQSTRRAANKRWHPDENAGMQADAQPCKPIQTDANACSCMQADAQPCNCTHIEGELELEEERVEEISGSAAPSSISLSIPDEETAEQIAACNEIERAGRDTGVFHEDWEKPHPDARAEREDFERMLAFPKPWVLEAMEKARLAQKCSSRYVLGILRSFKRQGKSDGEMEAERDGAKARGRPQQGPVFEICGGKKYYEGLEIL